MIGLGNGIKPSGSMIIHVSILVSILFSVSIYPGCVSLPFRRHFWIWRSMLLPWLPRASKRTHAWRPSRLLWNRRGRSAWKWSRNWKRFQEMDPILLLCYYWEHGKNARPFIGTNLTAQNSNSYLLFYLFIFIFCFTQTSFIHKNSWTLKNGQFRGKLRHASPLWIKFENTIKISCS